MSQKHYYVVKDENNQEGGVYPVMMWGYNPPVYGLPLLKPSLYPNYSTFDIEIRVGNDAFTLALAPALAQSLLNRLYEKQRLEKSFGNDVTVAIRRPSIGRTFGVGYGPLNSVLGPILTQPKYVNYVRASDAAGRSLTSDEILNKLKRGY